jgi:hypothetical protein
VAGSAGVASRKVRCEKNAADAWAWGEVGAAALAAADYRPGGTDVALADGGTGASLVDPNADRILFWDDSGGAVTWLAPSTGLSITTTNIISQPTTTLGPWFAEDLAGTASDRAMALQYMPTTTSVGQAGTSEGNEFKMPKAGRVVGAFLNANAARTAGTATLRVSVAGTPAAFASAACVLDGTVTTAISAWDDAGPTFTSGQVVRPTITTASWTPTTADVMAWLVVRFDT